MIESLILIAFAVFLVVASWSLSKLDNKSSDNDDYNNERGNRQNDTTKDS